jgi:hypothetical protein
MQGPVATGSVIVLVLVVVLDCARFSANAVHVVDDISALAPPFNTFGALQTSTTRMSTIKEAYHRIRQETQRSVPCEMALAGYGSELKKITQPSL